MAVGAWLGPETRDREFNRVADRNRLAARSEDLPGKGHRRRGAPRLC